MSYFLFEDGFFFCLCIKSNDSIVLNFSYQLFKHELLETLL